jgi:hypothetical protein
MYDAPLQVTCHDCLVFLILNDFFFKLCLEWTLGLASAGRHHFCRLCFSCVDRIYQIQTEASQGRCSSLPIGCHFCNEHCN